MESLDRTLVEAGKRPLVALFVAALVVHLVVLSQYALSPFFAVHRLDALFHDLFARQLLSGTSASEPYFRAPLYGWFLAGVYKLFGINPWAPRLVQAALGSGSVVLLYRLGCTVFRPSVGLIAALGMLLYGPLIANNFELHTPVLEVFLDLALLLALVQKCGWQAGLLLGLSALARPNILVLVPLIVYFLRSERRILIGFLATALLLPLAVTVRNYCVSGDAVFIASQGGINLYLGNRSGADGFTPSTPTRYRVTGEYEDSVALYGQRAAEDALKKPLTASESSRYWTQQALAWWRAHPADALRLTMKKAILAFSATEIRNNTAFAYLRARWVSLLWIAPLGFGIIGPLGGLGIALAWRRSPSVRLLALVCPLYAASFIAFFVADRYRLPLVPILCLFAAHAVTQLRVLSRAHLCLLLGMALLANGAWYPLPQREWESLDTWSAGNRLVALGRYPEAEAKFRQALTLNKENSEIWSGLGEVLYNQGRFADAERAFVECVRRRPESPAGWYNLALCLHAEKRDTATVEALQVALQRDASYRPAQELLRRVHGQK